LRGPCEHAAALVEKGDAARVETRFVTAARLGEQVVRSLLVTAPERRLGKSRHGLRDPAFAVRLSQNRVRLEEGRLRGVEIVLCEGDSAYYSAKRPHRYENAGDTPARVFHVRSPAHDA